MTQEKTYGDLENGDRICLHGYVFEVANVRRESLSGYNIDSEVVRFKGICTTDSRNDSIRNTAYNGGTYGAYPWIKCTVQAGYDCSPEYYQKLARKLQADREKQADEAYCKAHDC